jgi:hypothetical protein
MPLYWHWYWVGLQSGWWHFVILRFHNLYFLDLSVMERSNPLTAGLVALASLLLTNMAAVLLCSYFCAIQPTKRNLKTHLDWVFVIAMAGFVNVSVGG